MPGMADKPAAPASQSGWEKWQALTGSERQLLVEALFWLVIVGWGVQNLPFRVLARWLRLEVGEHAQSDAPALAARVGWAIAAASRRTPRRSTCLAQALAGKIMLCRRKIPATLYLGVAKQPEQGLQAHAWLVCGEQILTGQAEHEHFNVIAQYV